MSRRLLAFTGIWGLLLAVGLLWFAGSGTIREASGLTMGTSWSAQWVVPPWQDRQPGLAAEFASLLERLDRQVFSTWAAESELSRLNSQPVGTAMPVSGELLEVLRLSREISSLTGGAFDVTAGALVNLWGFGPDAPVAGSPRIPGEDEIREALNRTGADRIELDESASTAIRLADIYIDLSAVAKGYAVDRMAALLEERGFDGYFLEIGGELRISGRKPGFRPWLAALEAPDSEAFDIYAVVGNRGENFGIAGSGSYRNFFELEGERWSHQIDPRNGRPVRHELAAAYVIDPSAARADALATGLMVLGLAESRAFAESNGRPVYLIYADDAGGWSHYASESFDIYLAR
ncbi:MAG: FAD:protein FMN transferase [Gammaproteobacteria bacterium]|nr:FAD:protein FMN transferase [Gammaproteobacteria bacterium]